MDNEKIKNVIYGLLNNLPDSDEDDKGEDWNQCWDALTEESQDTVKEVRKQAITFLKGIGVPIDYDDNYEEEPTKETDDANLQV